jgi:serine/threonine protein kinase
MDLDKFLHNPQPYGLFDRKEMYYLALQGLASALLGVHNIKINKASHLVDLERIGSHRDIRLPNILVRPDTFLLADFGLTDFKNVNNERGSKTLFKAGRGDYIAPECYENTLKRQEVGRSMDIWAFGCILVEVATYMETGSDGLRQFQETRIGPWLPNFDNGYFFHERALKPIIVDHMSNLQGSASDHAYPKLLDLAQLMLQMEPKERLTAQEAWRGLSCICTLKLHGQVESALTSYDNFLSTGGGVGPSRIIQWFETERFRSWADTLGLHQDVKSHCTRLEDIIDFHASQTRLIELRDIVREHHKRVEYELHGDEDGLQLVLLHSQFEESLSKCMREIFSCLPPRLQKRADVWWTQRLLQDSTQQKLMELVDRSQSTGNEPYKELRRRALVKKNLIGLSENSAPSPELSQLRLNPDNVSGTRTCGFHDYGYYRNGSELIRVLIEPTFIATDEANRATIPTDELAIRKIALARLFATPGKPPDFHTLDCIGFVDVEQPGASVAKFVYKLPKGCQPDFAHHKPHNDPQSLLQILNKKSPGGPQVPPLEQRLQLAQTLVASLHSLHLNGWLHKSLNSDNVLIFESPAGVYDLAEPRIVGFKDSRPDGDIWTSAGPQVNPSLNDYAHPTYRRPHAGVGEQIRFRKAYDYYSLGTMLLEIGVWRSLESLLRKASNDPEARRVVLLQQLPVLRQFMGSTYASAVEKCLDTNFVEEKPGTGAEEQVNEFYLDVVEHITEIHV